MYDHFIEPTECLAVPKLPDAANWVLEVAMKAPDSVNLLPRKKNSFNGKFSYIVEALADISAGTVIGDVRHRTYAKRVSSSPSNSEIPCPSRASCNTHDAWTSGRLAHRRSKSATGRGSPS